MLRLALRHCLQAVIDTQVGADDREASALTRPLAAKLLRIRPHPAQQLAEPFDVARGLFGFDARERVARCGAYLCALCYVADGRAEELAVRKELIYEKCVAVP